jgi:iron complex outermembrane receptor protein
MWVAACFAAGISIVSSMALSSRVVAQTAEPVPAPPAAATPLPPVTVETTAEPKKAAAKKKVAKQKSVSPVATGPAPSQPQPPQAPTVARGAPNSGTGPVDGYLAEQTTTGTKTDTPLREVPQSVSVVGKQQMRDQGVQNLQEAFRYTPGIVADPYGYDSRGDAAIIRGITAPYFVDGLQTTYGFNSTTTMIEPYALERAEVLRGPGSMLYGRSAVGGLVNAISKLPSEIPYTEIGVEYGSFDFKQVKLDSTGVLTSDGKWLYRIVGLARDADTQVDFVDNDRLMLAPSLTYRPTKDTSITVLGNFRNDDSGSALQFLPAAGSLYPNKQGRIVPRDTFQGEPGDYYNTDAESVSLFVDQRLAPGLDLHHVSRYSHTDNAYDSHLPIVLTPLRYGLVGGLVPLVTPDRLPFLDADQTQVARLRSMQATDTEVWNTDTNLTARFSTGDFDHTVLGGFDYMRYSRHLMQSDVLVDNLITPTTFPAAFLPFLVPPVPGHQSVWDVYNPSYNQLSYYISPTTGGYSVVAANAAQLQDRGTEVQQSTGLYVQDQVKLGNWTAVLGLRQDWLAIDQEGEPSRSDQATTVRAALLYNFDFGLTPYISYSEAFTPQLGVRVGSDINTRRADMVVADALEGEQTEIGLKYQPDGAPFMISAAIYELTERNRVIDIDTLASSVQGAEVKVRGFEIEAVGKVTRELTAIASYSYTQAEYEKYPDLLPGAGFPAAMVGDPVEAVPEHLASLWGIYTLHDGFFRGVSVGAGVRYVGDSVSTGVNLGPDPFAPTYEQLTVKTPAFTLFDAMVAYETPDYRWQLTAQNLEDEYYVTACGAMRGDCFVGQGRTITTSFFYKF